VPNTALELIGQSIYDALAAKQKSRDEALVLSRTAIRHCANSIRASHRGEADAAAGLLGKARDGVASLFAVVKDYPDLRYMGFVDDAQKEFAEASIVRALILSKALPSPEDLGVDLAPYVNGLAEAASEMRRYILDRVRQADFTRCEELLEAMDDIYQVLVAMDFPDAMTGGLRRTTDMLRGVLERTRGDLTVALRQRDLEIKLERLA